MDVTVDVHVLEFGVHRFPLCVLKVGELRIDLILTHLDDLAQRKCGFKGLRCGVSHDALVREVGVA